jgi:glycosyltransferase involved in cell wall biosynthesis
MNPHDSLPTIIFAPVLRAEGWTSIDLHRQNCLDYYARVSPNLHVVDAGPDERWAGSRLGKRIVRDVLYPRHIRRLGLRHQTGGTRPILHVIDHSYGHLCHAWKPSVITCHDLNHFVCPEIAGLALHGWRKRVRGMLQAERIVTVSGHLADEVAFHLKIPRERLTVAYNGVDTDVFRARDMEAACARLPALAALRERELLVLNIGTNAKRKDLPTLLRAISLLRHGRKLPVKLLKVGRSLIGDGFGPLIESLGLVDTVLELGSQPPEAVADVCHLAHALSFPSRYEGFGRPTIEAQACGLPCVLADASCMREIGGTGALYHAPGNAEELASQLEQILTKNDLRQSLIALGRENSRRFTWARHIETLSQVYAEVASGDDSRGNPQA